MSKFLKFKNILHEGRIISRPNRFIMNVEINGKEEKCHCPVTGKIFEIDFINSNVPCLLSSSSNSLDSINEENNDTSLKITKKKNQRKTNWTVEAISLDKVETRNKNWIGINQTKVNSYIEYFLSQNQISFLPVESTMKIQREVKVGNSRIDFLIGSNHLLEVKTPLTFSCLKEPIPSHINLLTSKNKVIIKNTPQMDNTRLVKHFNELTNQMSSNSLQASVCLVFMYDANIFKPPPITNESIENAVKSSLEQGVTYHQINLLINSTGIQLLDILPLNLK